MELPFAALLVFTEKAACKLFTSTIILVQIPVLQVFAIEFVAFAIEFSLYTCWFCS